MKGLKEGFESLPRTRVTVRTTSASGPAREDVMDAIPLCSALEQPVRTRVIVRAEDGAALALSPQDAACACLAPLSEGIWQLIFPKDSTRRRFLKHPVAFETD